MFEKIKDPYFLYGILGIWTLFGGLILWYRRMLAIADEKGGMKMAIMSPLIAFLIFFSTSAYVPNWIARLMGYIQTHSTISFCEQEISGFSQLVALVAVLILLVGFSLIHSQEIRSGIWGQKEGGKAAIIGIAKGCWYTILTYPIVMLAVAVVHMVVQWFGLSPSNEQIAIVELRKLEAFPWLLYCYATAVVVIVPIVEELLFRGFLQNYISGLLAVRIAVIAASLVFASFHYAQEQAASNIGLMTGLFVYSYFMGVFYKKEASLWVTIGMHGCFNLLSLIAASTLYNFCK